MRGWLLLGPLAVDMEAPDWPWPWPALRARHPGRARWALRLRCEGAAEAGRPGPLGWADGRYGGPGFWVEPGGEGRYRAQVETPIAAMGALAAALVHEGPGAGFGLVHGALLAVGERGVLLLGPSGSGKSTAALGRGRRTLGSNAALLWEQGGAVCAVALPITGHGDASVGPRVVRVVGGLALGAPRLLGAGQAAARWVSGLATAVGRPPPLDLALTLARRLRLRGMLG